MDSRQLTTTLWDRIFVSVSPNLRSVKLTFKIQPFVNTAYRNFGNFVYPNLLHGLISKQETDNNKSTHLEEIGQRTMRSTVRGERVTPTADEPGAPVSPRRSVRRSRRAERCTARLEQIARSVVSAVGASNLAPPSEPPLTRRCQGEEILFHADPNGVEEHSRGRPCSRAKFTARQAPPGRR